MNVTQAAAKHLASQGVAFQGKVPIFQWARSLSPEQAVKSAEKGRPVFALLDQQTISVRNGTELVELDFFQAGGEGKGLKDPLLAHCVRALRLEAPSGHKYPAAYPGEVYRTLSNPDAGAYLSHPLLGEGRTKLDRDGLLALGYI